MYDYSTIRETSRLITCSIIATLFTAMPEAIYDRTTIVKENNMNFDLSEEQRALQASVRKFAQNELPEVAKKVEETNQPPGIELRKRYSELGYLGINISEQYGGSGGSHLDAVVVLEELAKAVSYTHLTLPTIYSV